jgi:hypothetical protein
MMSDNSIVMPSPRPYAPELVYDLARVQAHYLLRVLRENDGSFGELVGSYTSLQGMLPADYARDEFLMQAERLLLGDADTLSEDDRVERFMAYASPLFGACGMTSEAEYAGYQWFGCFRYHPHPEMNAISLHIRNNCMPQSPFDDLPACFHSLRRLGEMAAATEPFEIAEVMCGSWLNDLPIFLDFFPPSYRDSLEVSPPDSKSCFGWWGQLIDKTGRLHTKRAAIILETGVFPHSRKTGRCGFAEFMRYLALEGKV